MNVKDSRLSAARRNIAGMILPVILENILQMFASVVSMGMIGRVSTIAVSAQGLSSLLVGIIWNFLKGLSVASTVLVAKAHGANDPKRILRVGRQVLILLCALALLLLILVFLGAGLLLKVFNPGETVFLAAREYLRILVFGFPATAIMLSVTGILQGRGDTRTPMLIAALMNLVNILLGYPLIFGLGGFQGLGLRGAGIALVLAQWSGAGLGLFALFGKTGFLRGAFHGKPFKPDAAILKELCHIGIPTGLESIFWQAASIVLSRVMLSFGDIAYAANQLGLQAESLSEMPALGFGVAATAFTGQALGAGDPELGRLYIRELQKGALMVISFGTCLLLFFPRQVMSLLTNNQEVIALGAVYLRLMGLIQIPQNLQRVFTGALKGAGYAKIPMGIAATGLWGIRVPLALILSSFFHTGIVGIWAVVCVDQTARFLLSLYFYRRKKIWGESPAHPQG